MLHAHSMKSQTTWCPTGPESSEFDVYCTSGQSGVFGEPSLEKVTTSPHRIASSSFDEWSGAGKDRNTHQVTPGSKSQREETITSLIQGIGLVLEPHPSGCLSSVFVTLCSRFGPKEVEPDEELRVQILDLIGKLVAVCKCSSGPCFDELLKCLSSAIRDPCPDVQTKCCEVAQMDIWLEVRFRSLETLLSGLFTAVAHRHCKVRKAAWQGLSRILSSVTEDKGLVVDLTMDRLEQRLIRAIADTHLQVRAAAVMCVQSILEHRSPYSQTRISLLYSILAGLRDTDSQVVAAVLSILPSRSVEGIAKEDVDMCVAKCTCLGARTEAEQAHAHKVLGILAFHISESQLVSVLTHLVGESVPPEQIIAGLIDRFPRDLLATILCDLGLGFLRNRKLSQSLKVLVLLQSFMSDVSWNGELLVFLEEAVLWPSLHTALVACMKLASFNPEASERVFGILSRIPDISGLIQQKLGFGIFDRMLESQTVDLKATQIAVRHASVHSLSLHVPRILESIFHDSENEDPLITIDKLEIIHIVLFRNGGHVGEPVLRFIQRLLQWESGMTHNKLRQLTLVVLTQFSLVPPQLVESIENCLNDDFNPNTRFLALKCLQNTSHISVNQIKDRLDDSERLIRRMARDILMNQPEMDEPLRSKLSSLSNQGLF